MTFDSKKTARNIFRVVKDRKCRSISTLFHFTFMQIITYFTNEFSGKNKETTKHSTENVTFLTCQTVSRHLTTLNILY